MTPWNRFSAVTLRFSRFFLSSGPFKVTWSSHHALSWVTHKPSNLLAHSVGCLEKNLLEETLHLGQLLGSCGVTSLGVELLQGPLQKSGSIESANVARCPLVDCLVGRRTLSISLVKKAPLWTWRRVSSDQTVPPSSEKRKHSLEVESACKSLTRFVVVSANNKWP